MCLCAKCFNVAVPFVGLVDKFRNYLILRATISFFFFVEFSMACAVVVNKMH